MRKWSVQFLYDEAGSRDDFEQSFDSLNTSSNFYILKDEGDPEIHEVCYLTPEILKEFSFHSPVSEVMNNFDLDDLDLRDEWDVHTTRGYCQGDVATVLYKKGSITTDLIDHIFWDLQIDVHVSSDDGKVDEFISLGYLDKWDPKEIYKCISECIGLSEDDEKELMNLIPVNYPDYLY